jgi:Ca-activated chloride channel family protein
MDVLNPLAFWFALLAIPIVLLYLLRLRRRAQPVSSTLLWRRAILDREANTLWQRLRRNVLLLLQLATLAFLVFALARPYVSAPGGPSRQVVVLLDASASMQATDVRPSRFEAARAQVRALIETLGSEDRMTLIAVDGTPRALSALSNDKVQLRAALDALRPTLSAANWGAAVALAAAVGAGGEESTTFIFSDGANADDLALLPGAARFVPIGESGDNLAISTLALRRARDGLAALVRVTNHGLRDEQALVAMRAEEALIDARTLDVPAGSAIEWTIKDIPPDARWVQAGIEKARYNLLAADDIAYAINAANVARRALLVTPGNLFLEQALAALPSLRTTRAAALPPEIGGYDLYVLDGVSAALPAGANALLIGAQGVFTPTAVFSDTAYVRTAPHPIARDLDWRMVSVLDAYRLAAPDWLRPVVEGQGGPLVLAGESPDSALGRVVALAFDLRRSDLPLQIAFPILIANSVAWLAPPQGLDIPLSVQPGEVVALPAGARVTLPSGETATLGTQGFAQTEQPGVYAFEAGQVQGAFAVNFFNVAESRIAPNPNLTVGQSSPASATEAQVAQREFWHILAALALALLVIEWWVYQRGLPTLGRHN